MADYAPFTWVEKVTQVGPTRMNAIEAGLQDAAGHNQRGPLTGTGARPAAAPANKNWIWTDSATGAHYYSDGSAWWPMGAPAAWAPVKAASNVNINTASPGTTFDGYGAAVGDRILLWGQTQAPQNGIYIFNGSASAMTRAPDAQLTPAASDYINGRTVTVTGGSTMSGLTVTYTGVTNPGVGANITFTVPVAYFAPASGSANYAPASGSANYQAAGAYLKTSDSRFRMTRRYSWGISGMPAGALWVNQVNTLDAGDTSGNWPTTNFCHISVYDQGNANKIQVSWSWAANGNIQFNIFNAQSVAATFSLLWHIMGY